MKIAVSGERLGRTLQSTLNISINYFRPVSVNEFEAALERFKSTKFMDFWRLDCRTTEAARRRGIIRPQKVELR